MVPKSHFLMCVAFLKQLAIIVQTLQDIINCYGKYETAAKILKECRLWNRFHARAQVSLQWLKGGPKHLRFGPKCPEGAQWAFGDSYSPRGGSSRPKWAHRVLDGAQMGPQDPTRGPSGPIYPIYHL